LIFWCSCNLQGFFLFLFFQFCEVNGVAISDKRTWPNLSTGLREN
jgi:hypothetical protein